MSGLIEISDTASDLTSDVRGDSEPLPTTITTQSGKVMSDWASSHKETLLQWFLLHTFRLQSERRDLEQWTVSSPEEHYTEHALRETQKIYGLVEPSGKATDVTPGIIGESDPPQTTIATQLHKLVVDWGSGHTETSHHWLHGEPDELQRSAAFTSNVGAFDNALTKHELWLAAVQKAVRPCFAWPEIDPQSAHEAIIAVLRWWGRGTVADRLVYLRGLAREDPEESPIDLESLRAMARLLMSERQLPDPRTSVTSDGFVHIEWRFPSNGILAMVFLPSGLIRFAAVSVPASKGIEQLTVNGTLPGDKALAAVRQFTSYL